MNIRNMKKIRLLSLVIATAWACVSCTKADDSVYQPLDYAVQTVPTIDKVVPMKLIEAMGPYLHFGDTPPHIDTCFFVPRFHLDLMIKNDPSTVYFKTPQWFTYRFSWKFTDQHRCALDSLFFERRYLENYLYESGVSDTVFVMGNGNNFTAYYQQRVEWLATIPTTYPENLIRMESVIVCGRVIADTENRNQIKGVVDFKMGCITEYYIDKNTNKVLSHNNDTIGGSSNVPGIYDILIYSCGNDTLKLDPDFQPFAL